MIDSIIFIICVYLVATNKYYKLYVDDHGVDVIVTKTIYKRIEDEQIVKEIYSKKINLITFKNNS